MSIAGNLKTMEFAELLQFLARNRKTGTLVIDDGRVEKRIFFEKGKIISTASSDPKEYLGHFLVAHGYISEDELAQVMELQRKKKTLLGKILVTIGVVQEADLEHMLVFKAEESVYDVFSWAEGEFHFVDDELPDMPMVPMELEVTRLVLHGVQRQDEWARIRKLIPSAQAVPVTVAKLEIPEDDDRARRILELIDDDHSIEDIALSTHSSEFHVCRVVWEEARRGRVKVVRPRALSDRNLNGGSHHLGDADALIKSAEGHLDGGRLETALRYLRAARTLGPENRQVAEASRSVEERIREEIEHAGVVLDAIVHPVRSTTELADLPLTPQEGFVLSRVNGQYDVETILKISPLQRLEGQVVLWKLLQGGHVRLAR